MEPISVQLLLIACAIYSAVLACIHFVLAVRYERSLAHAVKPFAIGAPTPVVRALFLGDSLAVGVGASDPMHTVAGRFATAIGNIELENVARSGSRARDLEAQLAKASRQMYDVIVVQIGGNDVACFSDYAQVREQLTHALKLMKDRAPLVVLINMGDVGRCPRFTWPLTTVLHRRSKDMQKLYRRVVKKTGVVFVDLMRRRNDPTRRKKYMAEDGIHLSDAGYAHVFKAFVRVIRRRRPERRSALYKIVSPQMVMK